MPPSLDNPFRKPPRSKKEAEEISELLVGKKVRQTKEDTVVELSSDEQAIAEKEEVAPWTREQMEEWAKKFGRNKEWVRNKLALNEDGTWWGIFLEFNFITNPEEFPRGISFINSTLYLNGLKSAKGLSLPPVPIVYLNTLEDAQGLIIHERTKHIYLNSLKDSQGLRLPEDYSGKVYAKLLPEQQIRALKLKYPKATFK